MKVGFGLAALPLLIAGLIQGAATATAYRPPSFEAVELGPILRGAHPRVLGLDGAYSLPLGKGRSLWIFGDTLIGSWGAGGRRKIEGFPPNTAAIVDDRDWVTGYSQASFVGKDPRAVLQSSNPKGRIWPLDLVRVAGKTWLYFVEIEPKGKGPLDFEIVGYGVAPERSGPSHSFEKKGFLWPGSAPSFGTSVLSWEGHLYLYSGGSETRLARIPLGRPDRIEAYSYWAGEGRWESDWRKAAPLPGSGPEMSVRYNPYLRAFVMIFVPPFGRTVEARFAETPQGPWSDAVRVLEGQPQRDSAAMFYGAKQHVELDTERGRQIVISYNTNAPESLLESRPDLYWPRLARIRFDPTPP